jgi:hypothetical protein
MANKTTGRRGGRAMGGQDGTTASPQAVKVTRVAARWAQVRPGGLVSDPVRSMPNRRQDFRAHTELDRIYPARAAGAGVARDRVDLSWSCEAKRSTGGLGGRNCGAPSPAIRRLMGHQVGSDCLKTRRVSGPSCRREGVRRRRAPFVTNRCHTPQCSTRTR